MTVQVVHQFRPSGARFNQAILPTRLDLPAYIIFLRS